MTGTVLLAALLGAAAAFGWMPGSTRAPRPTHTRGGVAPALRGPEARPPSGWLRWRPTRRRELPLLALLRALAAELETGQPTQHALQQAVRDLRPDPCPRASQAARLGGDVAAALRQDAQRPGATTLRNLAACWEVAEHSGAGLALAVSRLADSVRASQESRAQLDAEVAAVRTSARLLALLPLFGLLIGHWIGAEPIAWLVGSWIGRLVLVAGVALQLLGLAWLRRMVAGVEALL